jgi:hypothetical protein
VFLTNMPASTIGEVIGRLTGIIHRSRSEGSRLGFFAALYRGVTIRVKEGIESGRFEDGHRMERLDVVFANRYLDALESYQAGKEPSACWQVAFQSAASSRLLVLQHLLLGMNAHINLDLGIAAAQTAPGDALPGLERDFDEISVLLGEMLDQVQAQIAQISPTLGLLDWVGGRKDAVVINFSMGKAREEAWRAAQRLASLPPEQHPYEIAALDRKVTGLSQLIIHPGVKLGLATLVIRLLESRDVARIIDVLA